jgi:hypothetical protein
MFSATFRRFGILVLAGALGLGLAASGLSACANPLPAQNQQPPAPTQP